MTRRYTFGRFEVRPDERQLLVDGAPAALGARALDLLVCLVERRDRVVSKEELLQLVWPGMVVEENNLTVHISALRKLLGAQALATVPGRGYRFTLSPSEPGAFPGATRSTEAPDADRKPVILVEKFTGSGENSLAADLAAEFRSELVDALSHRTGSRVATLADRAPAPTYVLSGRFLVVGPACRASLEMIEVATGETFWTEKLDEEITNVLEFLDRTVERVSIALRAHFNTYAGAAFAARPDNELNVQQLLTKAAYFIYRFDAENAARSRAVMEAAFERSPDSAIVVAMYSYTLVQTVPLAIDSVREVDAERAIRLADRAVSLGPDIDFVFHNRAKLRLWIQRDHDGCRDDAQRVLQINPTYHIAREDQACADIFSGNRAAGIRMLEDLVEEVPREPLSPFRKSIIAIGYALEGDMAAALQSARSGFEEKPFVPIHAIAYAAAASQDRKLARSQRFRDLMRERHIGIRDAERIPLSSPNDMARLKRLLEKALG